MEADLTPEERMIRETVRDFAEGVVAPMTRDWDRRSEVPPALMREIGEFGLLGIPFREEWGGSGASSVAFALAVEEMSRVDAWLALTVTGHVAFGCVPVDRFGTVSQKTRFLPPAIGGTSFAGWGISEPHCVGADVECLMSEAWPGAGGYTLSGTKTVSVWTGTSGYLVVSARIGGAPTSVLSSFIVPVESPGLSLRSLPSGEVRPRWEVDLDAVRVPDANLLGEEGAGIWHYREVLNGARIFVGAAAVGIVQASLELATGWLHRRTVRGPHAERWLMRLAELSMVADLARAAVLRAARLKDRGAPYGKEAAIAKVFAIRAARRVTRGLVRAGAGAGKGCGGGKRRPVPRSEVVSAGGLDGWGRRPVGVAVAHYLA